MDNRLEVQVKVLPPTEQQIDDTSATHQWRLQQAQLLLDAYDKGELPEEVMQEISRIIEKRNSHTRRIR